jgi:hypothetical protein
MRWVQASVVSVVFVTLGLVTEQASGACSCHCVNGQVQALCTSPLDIQPICSPTICPIVPPSIRPIEVPRIPPVGTRQCSNQQVYNPYTRQYEWKQICR